MNLRQLRCLSQVATCDFNLTTASRVLNTSQPGVSKQLLALEQELGFDILVRRGNRIVGTTTPGKSVLHVARRVLNDIHNLHLIREEFGAQDTGRLVLATTHTHVRYVLPQVIRSFRERYPRVQLVIRQENATRVAELVASGEADIGVSAESAEENPELLILPCYKLLRSVVTPHQHPLLKVQPLTIEAIAKHPIITLDVSFAGGQKILDTFANAGLKPNLAMTATDVDVVKFYVEQGLGIAIVPTVTFDPQRDRGLRAIEAGHVFEGITASITLRRSQHLLSYMSYFAQQVSPRWTRDTLEKALVSGRVPPNPIAMYPEPVEGRQRRKIPKARAQKKPKR